MRIEKNALIGAEHPLFRALVLMGGGLALSCGGISQGEPTTTLSSAGGGSGGGGSTSPGAGAASMSAGGAPVGTITIGGAGSAAGGAEQYPDGGAPVNLKCPYAQWSCTPGCYVMLANSGDPADSGCTCDVTRPLSASACAANESFVCMGVYTAAVEQAQQSWNGVANVNCSCVASPTPAYDNCVATCTHALPELGGQNGSLRVGCTLGPFETCDVYGVCTATSASVLRQDGIMCGCADIGLK